MSSCKYGVPVSCNAPALARLIRKFTGILVWCALAKVSVYIDDSTWKRFREQVFVRHGTLRQLSSEVEGLISSEDFERILAMTAKKVGIPIERELTPSAIKKTRPKLRGAVAEKIVRRMRDQHHGGRLLRQ